MDQQMQGMSDQDGGPSGVADDSFGDGGVTDWKSQDDDCKIFVGGLSWETTPDSLKEHFSKYGEVLDASVKVDGTTKKSRGFGFVLYADPDAVQRCLNENETHFVDGKQVDPKRAEPHQHKGPINPRARKVFVGGLHESITEEMIRDHFSRVGNVGEIDMPIDRNTQKRRGYCFVALDTEEKVGVAVQKRFQEISGYTVEVKKAIPDEKQERGSKGDWPQRGRGRGGGYYRGGGSGGGGGGGGYGGGPYSHYYNGPYPPYYQPNYGSFYEGYYQGYGGGGGGGYQGYSQGYGGGSYGGGGGYYGGGRNHRGGGEQYQQQGGEYGRIGPVRSYGSSSQYRQYPY